MKVKVIFITAREKVRRATKAQRKRVYRVHRVVGIALALWLVLLSVTGALLMFKAELDWLTTPSLRVAPAPDGQLAWDAEQVVRGVQAHAPEAFIERVDRPATSRSASLVRIDDHGAVRDLFVHPRTGVVLGGRDVGGSHHSAADLIRQLHVRVLLGAWGRTLVGVLGLVWIAALVTGWWVHGRKSKRAATRPRRAGAWRARLHASVAHATLPYALLMGVSGAWLGLETLPHLLAHDKTDDLSDAQLAELEALAEPPPAVHPSELARVDAQAHAALPGARVTTLFPPELVGQTWLASLEQTSFWLPAGAVMLDLPGAAATHGTLHAPRASEHLTGALEALHVGSFTRHAGPLDIPLRVLWALLGLTPVAVALAGLHGTYRRRQAQRRRSPTPEWGLPQPSIPAPTHARAAFPSPLMRP